ncbi:uncharacterized protein LOC112889369 isoform X3 [Panicum hallii]|uniref:uncharacterized protein LOC112889369 isoform X3 n=1 Tax=Panicum hallii TaxID=206008 RepID=UPI000DF4F10C|nr:uncharacterized protein LOC112889369 isoform X3 [Panicum hallii]
MAEEGKSSSGVRVCVTGGAGFIGSWLVKKLLERGYTVHATLRDTGARGVLLRLMAPRSDPPRRVGESAKKLKERRLVADRLLCVVARFRYLIPIRLVAAGDEEKAGLLRRLVPAAAERLRLFEADLFDAATFAPAIAGCRFVFLVATPYGLEAASSKYKTTAEAAVAAARVILRQCEESQTVKRVIHTASIASASPLKEGGAGAGYKDFISESCWTPLNVDYPLRSAHFDVSSEGVHTVEAAVGAGAPELQCRRAPGVRGGDPAPGPRRGRHGPRPRPGDAGARRVAGVPERALLRVPAPAAEAARLAAAGARGRRLRRAHLLRGPTLRRRPVPLRRRLPDHPQRRRPLRQQVPQSRRPQRVSPPYPYLAVTRVASGNRTKPNTSSYLAAAR